MALRTQPSTTEMQVTSIRFERSLIDQLKTLAGDQGYQSLVREVLWDYVRQHSNEPSLRIQRENIRAVMAAEAHRPEKCALTGNTIEAGEEMWMAFTTDNQLLPLSVTSIED